ncbi:hypothetical protein C6499_01830 [Candidatus Poribacteria bacterium]|nr:MAG: hypothetical protein C6499_01830 [Candidatus Poribacteria bacterium]
MSFFSLKFLYLVLGFLAAIFSVFHADASAQDQAEEDLSFEMLLAGIKHYDNAIRSGEGKCTYTYESFGMHGNSTKMYTWKALLTFDQHRTRMALEESRSSNKIHWPETVLIVTEMGTWEVIYHEPEKPSYYFQTKTELDSLRDRVDPRRWLAIVKGQDLPTYLTEEKFYIVKRGVLNNIPCYVLAAKNIPNPDSSQQMMKTDKFWISPEHGFRYLKHEIQLPRKVDSLDGSRKKGTPTVVRVSISYQQFGDLWFPKVVKQENARIAPNGEEHIYLRITLEVKDFKVNHIISPDTFTVDIPDDITIYVEDLRRKLTKKEFLKRYGQK